MMEAREVALNLARRNFRVVPLVYKTKKPIKGFSYDEIRDKLPSDEQVEEWFPENEARNLGIYPGGDFVILDFDCSGLWLVIAEQHGINLSYSYLTPGGGHIWLKEWTGPKLQGVEYIGKGGEQKMAVIPPSRTPHKATGEILYRFWPNPEIEKSLHIKNLPSHHNNGIPHDRQKIDGGGIEHADGKKYAYVHDDSNICIKEEKEGHPGGVVSDDDFGFDQGARDRSLYHTAVMVRRGGGSRAKALEIVGKLAEACDPPFKDWEAKVGSAYDRPLPRERGLTEEIREWISGTKGDWSGTELDKELEIGTKRDKETRRKVTTRLVNAGVIKRCKKNGWFRKCELEEVQIDPTKQYSTELLSLQFPLGLEEYVGLYPGCIAVINGVKDVGKTGFLLRFLALNMYAWSGRIHYFNSEMGPEELCDRRAWFDDIPWEDWRHCRLYERSGDFCDVIRPNDVNIIDFMEIHDEHWKVGGLMREIHEKLGKGCCLVALQKHPQKDYGSGGIAGVEKARLVINLDREEMNNYLTIKVAKCRANPDINPRGLKFRYKLASGCHWVADEVEDPNEDVGLHKDERGQLQINRRAK